MGESAARVFVVLVVFLLSPVGCTAGGGGTKAPKDSASLTKKWTVYACVPALQIAREYIIKAGSGYSIDGPEKVGPALVSGKAAMTIPGLSCNATTKSCVIPDLVP